MAFNSLSKQPSEKVNNSLRSTNDVVEDEVDQQLSKSDGTIKRERDSKLYVESLYLIDNMDTSKFKLIYD